MSATPATSCFRWWAHSMWQGLRPSKRRTRFARNSSTAASSRIHKSRCLSLSTQRRMFRWSARCTNPGVYPAFGSHRLFDYISLAQGLTPLAGTRVTVTHTGHPDEPDHVKMVAGMAPRPENNPEVLPGDTIFVERTGVVYVVGDVARPGGFPMDHDEQLTILQAVALAQGTNPTAAKGSAKALRTTSAGTPGASHQFEKDPHCEGDRPCDAGQ